MDFSTQNARCQPYNDSRLRLGSILVVVMKRVSESACSIFWGLRCLALMRIMAEMIAGNLWRPDLAVIISVCTLMMAELEKKREEVRSLRHEWVY